MAPKKAKLAWIPCEQRGSVPAYRSPRSAAIVDEYDAWKGSRTFDGPHAFGLVITPEGRFPYTLSVVDTAKRSVTELPLGPGNFHDPTFHSSEPRALVFLDDKDLFEIDLQGVRTTQLMSFRGSPYSGYACLYTSDPERLVVITAQGTVLVRRKPDGGLDTVTETNVGGHRGFTLPGGRVVCVEGTKNRLDLLRVENDMLVELGHVKKPHFYVFVEGDRVISSGEKGASELTIDPA